VLARPRKSKGSSCGFRGELGDVDVLLYDAAMRPFGRLLETKPSTFENT
jgi:hypothetical protein